MNGKGDTYRPYDPEVFAREHERIFGKKEPVQEKKPEPVLEPPNYEKVN